MIHGLPVLALKSGREEQRCWESEKVKKRQRQRGREREEREERGSRNTALRERDRQTERKERFQSKPAILSTLRFSTF